MIADAESAGLQVDDGGAPRGLLRAVLAADAVGYSRLMPEDPVGTIASLKRQRERMREIVARRNGREAGFPGDFLLALFVASNDALASAIEFLDQLEQPGSGPPLQFRVGLHVGDLYEQSGEFLGMAINIASRLQQLAPVGGILMSQGFRATLPGRMRHQAEDIGELQLKNVDEPIRAYELRRERFRADAVTGSAPAPVSVASAPHARRTRSERRPRILVRAFRVQGAAERAAVFADGIVEELVTTLGVFSDVFRSVSATEPGDKADGYEITGHVRNGDRLRITCQMVDRSTGQTLWSDRFDFGNDASYDAQERIAIAVVTALQVELTEGEGARLWSSRPTSIAAWEEFHRGRMAEARYTRDSNLEARAHFARAADIDPQFVPAIVGLGFNRLDAIRLGWTDDGAADLDVARRMADSALARNSGDPYAIALLAYVERAEGKLDRSVATMRRATQTAPRNGELVAYFGEMLSMQGDVSGAIGQYRRALDLIPQPSSWIRSNLGLALLWDGRVDEAYAAFESTIGADPDYVRGHIGLVVALMRQGKIHEARRQYGNLLRLDPAFEPQSWVAGNAFLNPAGSERFIADLKAAAGAAGTGD